MARVRTIQNSYTSGELDPLLAARTDVKHYYLGAERIRNCVVIPQGGARRRPGLQYISEIQPQLTAISFSGATVTAPNGGTAGNATDANTATEVQTNDIGTTNPFVIVHVDFASAKDVRFVDVEGLRCTTGASSSQVCWQYSTDNAAWTTLGDAFDLVDGNDRHKRRGGTTTTARYWRLARIGATDMGTNDFFLDEIRFWSASASLSEARIVEHEFSTTQIYAMLFTDRNCAVYRNDVKQADIPTPYTSAMLRTIDSESGDISTINWTQNLDTLLVVHGDSAPRKVFRDGAHDEWNPSLWPLNTKPTHPFSRVTSGTGTPSSGVGSGLAFGHASDIVSADVGKYIRGNGGYAKITSYSSTSNVVVSNLDAFDDTAAIPAGEWTIEEDVWSDTRGWPLSALFFQNRLTFAGSRDRPGTFWASKSATPFNFSVGDASVIDAIDVTPDTGDVAAFSQLHAGRHLQVFSSSREFYFPNTEDAGLTPENAFMRSTTKRGAKKGLRVFEVDGATIFVQRYGKALRELIFVDVEQAYQANNLSLLSSHLIGNPVGFSHRRATSTSEADYFLIVNEDGTLTVFNTLRDQQINAFSLCETDGDFIECGVAGRDMYFVVERSINGTTRRFFEKFNDDLLFDCAASATAVASSTTALSHLAGETVGIILDDSIQPDKAVAGGGTLTFDRASETDWQAGLHFPDLTGDGDECYIRDMPVEPNLPDGTAVGRRKRVVEATVRLYETTGCWINGNPLAFRQFGSDLLDTPITPFTGDKQYKGLLGWDSKAQVTLSARGPYKFTVLGLAKKVAI